MRQKILNIFFVICICALSIIQCWEHNNYNSIKGNIPYPIIIKIDSINNFKDKTPQKGLYEALLYHEIKHPEIVYAQAVLETGNFTSNLCVNHNNLFGLYNSSKRKYYSFNHWENSVLAYKTKVQYRYKGGSSDDYYKFLQRIGYAEDKAYISKLKTITND